MRDDIGDAIRYALSPRLLVLYAVVFVGEFLRGFVLRPFGFLNGFGPLYDAVGFVLGLVSFGFDVVGFLLVVVGLVAILRTVLRDVTGDDATGSLGASASGMRATSDGVGGDEGPASAAGGE